MEAVSNITNVASKALFGEGEHEASGREPVSGRLGNVAAGEPYDGGNLETPKTETPSMGETGSADDFGRTSATTTSATNGKTGLFNPILPAGQGASTVSDYTRDARRVSAISADSRTSDPRSPSSPTLGNVRESPAIVGAVPGSAERNGVAFNGKETETRKTSDPSVTYDTRSGGRRTSRRGSGSRPITDRGELAFRSVSREHERRQSEKNALAPLSQTESARRRAANAVDDDGLDERVGGPIGADTTKPMGHARKLSLKDKIKAKFTKI